MNRMHTVDMETLLVAGAKMAVQKRTEREQHAQPKAEPAVRKRGGVGGHRPIIKIQRLQCTQAHRAGVRPGDRDRKSTRLNSSH